MLFDWKRDYGGNLEWLPTNTILLTVHGSHAYGLATETSDVDIKGIAIPPRQYFTGFMHRFEQAESKDPDMVVYDIRKFFALAADCNPNIIEVLWTDDADIISINQYGEHIRHFKTLFLSKKAKYTFSGYAIAQLKRIKTHRKWLLNPPSKKPERSDFGLPQTTVLSAGIIGAIQSLESKGTQAADFGPHVMHAYQRERGYFNALREFQQYEQWKASRNPKRAEIEAKYGYDCKHAMHLVRLLRMCEEILSTGQVLVKRPDRDELLAIRNGAWEYDQLIEWAERQDKLSEELLAKSSLPNGPDRQYLDTLCRTIVEEAIA